MLSLLCPYSEHIILLRDTQEPKAKRGDESSQFSFVDISRLSTAIIKELTNELRELPSKNLILDYIFMCFLLGNDFLEHIPSLMIKENGVNILMRCYVKVKRNTDGYLVQNDNINLPMLKNLFYELSILERGFFDKVYSVYQRPGQQYRDPICKLEELNNNDAGIFFYTNDIICFNKEGYKKRYYTYYNTVHNNNNGIDDLCRNYITGLYWTLGYYTGHAHNNWSWYYPYHCTPFVSDLYDYLRNFTITFTLERSNTFTLERSNALTPLEQLFMVLPEKSLLSVIKELEISSQVYDKLYRILNNRNSNVVQKIYPRTLNVDLIHREYLWQSKLFLEEYDISFIKLILSV